MTAPSRRQTLGLVFLTVFLDVVGFSIIFPLFPQMLEHYLALEGDASLVGRLVASLSGLAGGDEWRVTVLFGGVLGATYSLLQFLFAPVWGGLSDRMGRRPTLLFTLAGTALSYVVWFFAGSFAVLLAARLLGGIMAGNISTASAVVSDVSSEEDRAKGMGLLGAGIGLGFVMGPALGGIFAQWDLAAGAPATGAFAMNPFSAPAAAALALALLNLVWALRRFPETLPEEQRGQRSEERRRLNPLSALKKIDVAGVKATNAAYFFYLVAFGAIEFTLTFLCVERLAFGTADNAKMFVFVGLMIALVQGGFVRRLVPRMGERKLSLFGLVLTAPGFVLIGTTTTTWQLYAGLTCMAIGSAFVMPCLSALVSRYAPREHQGLALGTIRSLGALSRAIGPFLGGLLYFQLGSAAPYWAGAAFLVLPLLLGLRLPEPTSGH